MSSTNETEKSTGGTDPEQLREEIEQTRAELGDTVEALAEKSDVKAQAKKAVEEKKADVAQKVEETKATVTGKAEDLKAKATEATPESALGAASQAQSQVQQTARENPIPVAAAGAFVLGFLIGRFTKNSSD